MLKKVDKYTITLEKFPTEHVKIKCAKTYAKQLEEYLNSKKIKFKQYTKGYDSVEYHLIGSQDFDKLKSEIDKLTAKSVML